MRPNDGLLRRTRQRGFTLLEVIGALAVSSFALASFVYLADDAVEDTRARTLANYLSELNAGATRFLNANYSEFMRPQSGVAVQAGEVRVFDLNEAAVVSFFPAGFSRRSPYGHTACIAVSRTGNEVEAYALAAGATTPIPQKNLRMVAANAGPNMAWMNQGGATAVSGVWNRAAAQMNGLATNGCRSTTIPTALVPLQQNDFVSQLTRHGVGTTTGAPPSAYLYRDRVQNRPDLNQMLTDLNMGGNSITNTAVVSAATVTATNVIGSEVTGSTVTASRLSATTATFAWGSGRVTIGETGLSVLNAANSQVASLGTNGIVRGTALTIDGTATVGGACNSSTDGGFKLDAASRDLLSCTNQKWQSVSSPLSRCSVCVEVDFTDLGYRQASCAKLDGTPNGGVPFGLGKMTNNDNMRVYVTCSA